MTFTDPTISNHIRHHVTVNNVRFQMGVLDTGGSDGPFSFALPLSQSSNAFSSFHRVFSLRQRYSGNELYYSFLLNNIVRSFRSALWQPTLILFLQTCILRGDAFVLEEDLRS